MSTGRHGPPLAGRQFTGRLCELIGLASDICAHALLYNGYMWEVFKGEKKNRLREMMPETKEMVLNTFNIASVRDFWGCDN